MEFEKLVIKNFLSFQAEEFVGFDQNHLVLVEGENLDEGGSNGSGKSAIWDAIAWALFGQTTRGLKGDEVIHRRIGKNCSVEVCFKNQGRGFLVRRYRKCDRGDGLSVVCDGRTLDKGTSVLTQEYLCKELGIDFDLFRCTVLFAQGETFNFVDASNKDQKDILSKILKIDFLNLQESAKELSQKQNEERLELDRKLSVLSSHLVEDPESLFEIQIAEWRALQADKIDSLKEKLKGHIAETNSWAKSIVVDKHFEKDKTENSDFLDKVNVRLQRVEVDSRTKDREKQQIDERMIIIDSAVGVATCSTCLQPVDKALLQKEAGALQKQSRKLFDEIGKLIEDEKNLKEAVKKLKAIISNCEEKLSENKKNKYHLEMSKKLTIEMAQRVVDLEKEPNPFKSKIEEEIKKQKEIRTKIDSIKVSLSSISSSAPYYEFWANAFGDGGIKSFLFDLVCSGLTAKANSYANVLTNGFATISFDTQKQLKSGKLTEKFDCMISTDGERVPYAAYSGGEKRKISLSVDMALSELMSENYGSKFNMVVFDEQDSFLDTKARLAYMGLLNRLAKEKSVFVVAHDAEFRGMFQDVWTVQKQNGVSRLL